MHTKRADLNLFVVFSLIYAEGSLTGAAKKLGLTQPAVSHSLARLRELMNDPLFVRQGHRMIPTPLARRIIQPVRESIHGLEVTLNRVESFDPATARRRLVLGMHEVLEPLVLPRLMQAVEDQAPHVELAITHTPRRDLETELMAGTLDVAVDVLIPISESLMCQQLFSNRLVVLARQGHPELDGKLDLKTYLEQGHILVSARRRGGGLVDTELSRHNVKRQIRLRCQHYYAACEVVSRTNLLLTLPENQAKVVNRSVGNHVHPFPIDEPAQVVYMYWRKSADEDQANLWFRGLLSDFMRFQSVA